MRYIQDPYLKLYLPLRRKLGSTFMSDDAYGHLCTATGAIWTPQGRSFDGVDDYINLDTVVASLASSTKGTLIIWLSPTVAIPAADNSLFGFGDTNANEYITGYIKVTTGLLIFEVRDAGIVQFSLATDAAPFSNNIFAQAAFVQNGSNPVTYINGIAVAQAFTVSTNKAAWFADCSGIDNGRIGTINMNNLGEISDLSGKCGEVAIFSRALTPSEISRLYLKTKGRYK